MPPLPETLIQAAKDRGLEATVEVPSKTGSIGAPDLDVEDTAADLEQEAEELFEASETYAVDELNS